MTVTVTERRSRISVQDGAAITVRPRTSRISVGADGGVTVRPLPPVRISAGAAPTITVRPQVVRVAIGGAAAAAAESATLTYDAENKQGTTLAAGEAVAVHSSGTGVVRASAADTSKPCVGLNTASASAAASATIQTRGPFEIADWSAITGAASLTRGPYFLDPSTPGRLTATAPTTPGQIAQPIGWAVSATVLDLNPGPYVLL